MYYSPKKIKELLEETRTNHHPNRADVPVFCPQCGEADSTEVDKNLDINDLGMNPPDATCIVCNYVMSWEEWIYQAISNEIKGLYPESDDYHLDMIINDATVVYDKTTGQPITLDFGDNDRF